VFISSALSRGFSDGVMCSDFGSKADVYRGEAKDCDEMARLLPPARRRSEVGQKNWGRIVAEAQ
jgi:hypothetical protein